MLTQYLHKYTFKIFLHIDTLFNSCCKTIQSCGGFEFKCLEGEIYLPYQGPTARYCGGFQRAQAKKPFPLLFMLLVGRFLVMSVKTELLWVFRQGGIFTCHRIHCANDTIFLLFRQGGLLCNSQLYLLRLNLFWLRTLIGPIECGL